jgi:hypothetical protein
MKRTKFLLPILLLLFFVVHYLFGQKESNNMGHIDDCSPSWAKKGDTLDFDFYNRYSENSIEIEWRKKHKKNSPTNISFCYGQIFKIKNNFSHDIYLNRTLGDAVPGCFTYGLIKPDSIVYTSIYLDLEGKTSLSRPVVFIFTFCPNTPEEERYMVQYHFEGTKK